MECVEDWYQKVCGIGQNTVDISLHTPVKMASFCDEKKLNEGKSCQNLLNRNILAENTKVTLTLTLLHKSANLFIIGDEAVFRMNQ